MLDFVSLSFHCSTCSKIVAQSRNNIRIELEEFHVLTSGNAANPSHTDKYALLCSQCFNTKFNDR